MYSLIADYKTGGSQQEEKESSPKVKVSFKFVSRPVEELFTSHIAPLVVVERTAQRAVRTFGSIKSRLIFVMSACCNKFSTLIMRCSSASAVHLTGVSGSCALCAMSIGFKSASCTNYSAGSGSELGDSVFGASNLHSFKRRQKSFLLVW
jgi:hypothetical protein